MTIFEEGTVKLDIRGQKAEMTINRPESLNALNADVLQGIILAFDKIAISTARVVVITGEGERAFVAGADIATMSQLGPRAIADYVELGQRAMRVIEESKLPVIAGVNGFALGGGMELSLACDIILASDKAKFGQPEINLGLIPGFGGTQRLIKRCGIGSAKRLILTGDMISAQEALRIGLVDELFSEEEFKNGINGYCERIIAKAPIAIAEAKRVIRESQDPELLYGLRREVDSFLNVFKTADREEGTTAFLQKRPPQFKGK